MPGTARQCTGSPPAILLTWTRPMLLWPGSLACSTGSPAMAKAGDKSLPLYPRRAQITRAVAAARHSGIEVAEIELGSDGSIRISSSRPSSTDARTEFDRWDAAGRL